MQPTNHKESSAFDEAYKEAVADKSATDMADMMYNTATPRSGHSLADLDANEMLDNKEDIPDEEPPEEHDDHDQAKLIKDMTEVPTNDENRQTLNRLSATHESTYQEEVMNEPYQENGSCDKNMMMMALHHPRDRQNQTTSPALTLMQGASRGQGVGEPQEDRDDPLRNGGGGGHN
jgi:hypothetical protein